MSQRTRILLIVLLIAMPLALLAGAFLWRELRSEEQRVAHDRVNLAEAASLLVDSFIEGHVSTARAMAIQPPIVRPRGDAALSAYLRGIVAENPEWEGLGLIGPDGYSMAASQGGSGLYLGDRPYFQKAVASGHAAVSSALIGRISGLPTIIIAAPVIFHSGGRGALIVPLPTERLGATLSRRIGSSSAQVIVIDDEGRTFIHPEATRVKALESIRTRPAAQAALAGQSGTSIEDVAGTSMLVAYAPVRDYRWGVLIAEPASLAFGQARNRAAQSALLFALILAGVVALGWFLGGRIIQGETRLWNSRERLRVTLASIGDAVITTNVQGAITYLNPVAETLTAWSRREAIGRPVAEVFQLVDGETRRPLESPTVPALAEGRVVNLAARTLLVTRDGREIPIDDSAAPIREAGGSVIGCVLIFRDISVRQQAEQEIHHLLSRLSDNDHRKDEFLAMLAHELRAPLAPLRNCLEIMKRAPADQKLMDQVRSTMDRQLSHMVRLIEDLLDISRITGNKMELRKQRLELASVVNQALEATRPLIESAGHKLEVSLPPEPVCLEADPARLTQIFSNMLTNACKYTEPRGNISLVARATGGAVEVSIRDSGIGISPEMLQRVFELFVQADLPPERAQGGLGLGLTLVKRLVEMHGGTIEARSEGRGQGSEFVVRLPMLEAA